jgi:hypothetical protein
MNKNTQTTRSIKYLGLTVMIMAALTITACGGSSGSGSGTSGGTDVSALALPDRIELTNVQDQSASSRFTRSAMATKTAWDGSASDYTNEVKHSWVQDTDALDMINTVLGVVKDTGYAGFVNKGAYKALVRNVDDSKQAGSGSDTTSTTTEQLMEIYVNVTRASNDDPMIVKIWLQVPSGPDDKPMLVRGYFTVTQGVSDEYPFGVMTAHFKGNTLNTDGSEGNQVMKMALSVNAENGQVVLENVDDESAPDGTMMRQQRVQVVANADVTEGNAFVMGRERDHDSGNMPDFSEQEIAFNPQYFKKTVDGTDHFFSKDNLKHRVFNYKLFDATNGDKIELSSGFPIETAGGQHGYVGYYGLWTPTGVSIANGDTVTDLDGNSYTVFRSTGKLTKHTKSSMLLGDLDGVEMYKSVCDPDPNIGCQDTAVTWDSASGHFIKLGFRNQNGQIVYYAADDPQYQAAVTFQQWEGAWCESLQAYLRLGDLYFNSNGSPATPSDTSTVYYYAEQTLDPSTATNLTLHTWEFSMDPIDQDAVNNYNQNFNNYWGGTPTEKTFTFDAVTMMLYDHNNDPVTLDGLTIAQDSMLNNGYHIGPLTTDAYYLDHSPYIWQANEADTFYSWNTGTDPWNQLVTVKDSNGDFVHFDPPKSFAYTHSTDNDLNHSDTNPSPQDGKTFRLEYDGFSVQIPWNYDPATDQWKPLINIKDGTLMGPNGDDYVIKGTDEALVMAEVSDPGVDFPANAVGEPSLTYDATKTALVGDVPTTAQLKVIKGDVLP